MSKAATRVPIRKFWSGSPCLLLDRAGDRPRRGRGEETRASRVRCRRQLSVTFLLVRGGPSAFSPYVQSLQHVVRDGTDV